MSESATFAAGCFWGVEHVFRQFNGVLDAACGYMGGTTDQPNYADVCTDTTGHAEVVQITFDENVITYEQLLDVFWQCHDPTQLNRQGEDIGTQYRSAIFWHSAYQKDAAEKSLERVAASDRFAKRPVTEITPASEFFRAEEYHQRYFEKNGEGSCQHACPIVPPKNES